MAILSLRGQPIDQRRLADARLAADKDKSAPPGKGRSSGCASVEF